MTIGHHQTRSSCTIQAIFRANHLILRRRRRRRRLNCLTQVGCTMTGSWMMFDLHNRRRRRRRRRSNSLPVGIKQHRTRAGSGRAGSSVPSVTWIVDSRTTDTLRSLTDDVDRQADRQADRDCAWRGIIHRSTNDKNQPDSTLQREPPSFPPQPRVRPDRPTCIQCDRPDDR